MGGSGRLLTDGHSLFQHGLGPGQVAECPVDIAQVDHGKHHIECGLWGTVGGHGSLGQVHHLLEQGQGTSVVAMVVQGGCTDEESVDFGSWGGKRDMVGHG